MKKTSIFFLSVAALSAPTFADSSYVTAAKVVESKPIIETVYEPVESCHYEYRRDRNRSSSRGGRSNNTGEKLIGGLIGGGAGSAFGKGSGRDAAAAIGALIGSEVADGDGLSGGELIGGIAGGVAGNQFGKGSGKTAATAVGTLLGAIVGDNIQNSRSPEPTASQGSKKKVRVCTVEDKARKVITGYEITFEYNNFRFTDVVSRRPGDFIDVNVNVEVIEDLTSTR